MTHNWPPIPHWPAPFARRPRTTGPTLTRRLASGALIVAAVSFPLGPSPVAQGGDTTPPALTAQSPSPNATGVSTLIDVRAIFDEAVQQSTLSMVLRNSSGQIVLSQVSYDPATRAATLDPTTELAGSQTFTVTVTGVRDHAGNQMTQASWSFTTATAGFEDVVLPQTGLVDPTVIQFAADNRVFVAEKSGRIWLYTDLTDATPTLVADLRVSVYNYWDRGMLGMALHPNFPFTPYIYVLYAYDAVPGGTAPRWGSASNPQLSDSCPDPPGATANGCVVTGRLSRLNAGNPVEWPLDHTDEESLITDWFQQFQTHSIGALAFGPDGGLYASAGDGASSSYSDYGQTPSTPSVNAGGVINDPPTEGGAVRSQDIQTDGDPVTLNGALIRIDPDTGVALPDTPRFTSDPDPNGKRIVAYGLRNPFRLTFRPGTREVWVGDVGWATWEEINRVVDPIDATVDNFGWPCYEGSPRQSGYEGLNLHVCENLYAQGSSAVVAPYYAYHRNTQVVSGEACPTGGSSISGLAFYSQSGGAYPSSYDGALFFADFSRNCIWAMLVGANGLPDPTNRVTIKSGAGGPVHLIAGPDGDIFYAGIHDDRLHRIRYFSGNLPPAAAIQANPSNGPSPLTVTFNGAGSSDPEGESLSHIWDLDGDGAFDDASGAAAQSTYTGGEMVTARLRVIDPSGLSDVAAVAIAANNSAPTATIDAPTRSFTWKVGNPITFSGHGADADEPSGVLPPSSLSWDVIMHHCPSNCHTHPIQNFAGVAAGSFAGPDHEYPSHLELRLTATDAGGLQSSASVLLQPQTVDLTFQTSPPGLRLTVNAAAATTPFARTVIVGSANSIGAPTPQMMEGVHQFTAWSDGGAQTHILSAPVTATTYRATFSMGRLSATVSTPTTPQSLPALGLSDWAHWGHLAASDYTRKSGVTPQISDVTVLGNSSATRYTGHPFGFTWTGGTPTAVGTNSTTGLYVGGGNNGFAIAVPADPTPRTLTVFVGTWSAQGRLVAHLSDNSAPDYVDTSISHATGVAVGMYQLTYQAANPGQTLSVTFTQDNATSGVVAIQAAALRIGQADPSTVPTNLRATVVGNEVTLQWEAPTSGSAPVGYVVEAGSASGFSNIVIAPTGSGATTLSTVAPNGTYYVRVRAVTPEGTSGASNEVVAQVGCAGPPPAPSGLAGDVVGSQVTLTWDSSGGATRYEVHAGSASGLSNLAVAPVAGSGLVVQAPPGTYFVRVIAHDACGVSPPSSEIVIAIADPVALRD